MPTLFYPTFLGSYVLLQMPMSLLPLTSDGTLDGTEPFRAKKKKVYASCQQPAVGDGLQSVGHHPPLFHWH